ncbi:uncharacterized protein METZ01_LOCUS244829 [marine metagenome]|uniref:Uncharacterized protein n=1 Tax=marine metagenome TaxID=408172 RepID=A0A382HXU5_9ZZZZ
MKPSEGFEHALPDGKMQIKQRWSNSETVQLRLSCPAPFIRKEGSASVVWRIGKASE